MAVFPTLRNTALAVLTLAAIAQPAVALPMGSSSSSIDFDRPTKLFARQSQVSITPLNTSEGQIPFRREWYQFQQDNYAFNIYLLAMERLQAQSQSASNPTGYYQLAGIHGAPFTAWDQVSGGNDRGGYCLHGDQLFPSWHRPYLLLMEAQIYKHANDIAKEFTDPYNRQLHMNAAANFRMPYWDWATNPAVPDAIGSWSQITVLRPDGKIYTIHNPLYSYRFQDLSELPGAPFNQMPETVRNPGWDGRQYVSQPAVTNRNMINIGQNLRSRAYNLLTAYHEFASFSNHAPGSASGQGFDSIESLHDTVHGTVGGRNGHMSIIDYAAFDPIFWLHHTNIDRLVALWQAIHPGTWVGNSVNNNGTFSQPPGTVENGNTPLTPFHASSNSWWTSNSVMDIRRLGYNYPELADSGNVGGSIISYVQRTYGDNQPPMALFNANPSMVSKRIIGSTMPTNNHGAHLPMAAAPHPKTLAQAPSPGQLTGHHEKLVEDNSYNEYITNIQCNAASLGGSFNVHVFFGDVPEDKAEYATSPNLVGTYTVFTMADPMSNMVAGTVPLTSALLNKVVEQELENLKPETVHEYLDQKMQWRVAAVDASNDKDHCHVQELKIQVVTAKVQLPSSVDELPEWGPFEVLKDVTQKPTSQPSTTQSAAETGTDASSQSETQPTDQ